MLAVSAGAPSWPLAGSSSSGRGQLRRTGRPFSEAIRIGTIGTGAVAVRPAESSACRTVPSWSGWMSKRTRFGRAGPPVPELAQQVGLDQHQGAEQKCAEADGQDDGDGLIGRTMEIAQALAPEVGPASGKPAPGRAHQRPGRAPEHQQRASYPRGEHGAAAPAPDLQAGEYRGAARDEQGDDPSPGIPRRGDGLDRPDAAPRAAGPGGPGGAGRARTPEPPRARCRSRARPSARRPAASHPREATRPGAPAAPAAPPPPRPRRRFRPRAPSPRSPPRRPRAPGRRWRRGSGAPRWCPPAAG